MAELRVAREATGQGVPSASVEEPASVTSALQALRAEADHAQRRLHELLTERDADKARVDARLAELEAKMTRVIMDSAQLRALQNSLTTSTTTDI